MKQMFVSTWMHPGLIYVLFRTFYASKMPDAQVNKLIAEKFNIFHCYKYIVQQCT